MDRRTLLAGAVGLVGAGATVRLARLHPKNALAVPSGPPASAAPARQSPGVGPIKSIALAQVPLGAGGFITGLDISTDGQRFVCRTDVANAYVRDSGDAYWRPLFSPTSLRLRGFEDIPDAKDKADANGAAGVRIAPSNKDVIYATYHGFVWKSDDGGRTVQRCGLPQKTMHTNRGWQRLFNRTIDVHPRSPDRVVVGTWGEGVWYSLDGGKAWSSVSVPAAGKSTDDQPGLSLIAYDPNANDRIYIFVTGAGLFRSDTGPGGQFQHLDGGPLAASQMVASIDGSITLCEHTRTAEGGRIHRYFPDKGWSATKPPYEALTIAIDPRRPARAILINPNGFFMESLDGCATFRPIEGGHFVPGGEIGWVAGLKTFFPSEAQFDPKIPDRLWVAQGVGVVRTKAGGDHYELTDWSAGIEELGTTSIVVPTGGKALISAWDKPFWKVDQLTGYGNEFRYPLRSGKSYSADLVAFSSALDVAGDNPSVIVGIVAPDATTGPGISVDGGTNWRVFEGQPAAGWGNGGWIAASTSKNIVLLPSNNGVGAYTLDGGQSWEPIKLDGVTPTAGFANAFYTPRRNLSADKTRPGCFALVYTTLRNNEYGEPRGGLWLTQDGGRSWKQALQGVITSGRRDPQSVSQTGADPRQFWACQLSYVPGRTGELVYTSHADFKEDRFFWSKDDGANWAEFSGKIRNVACFGFGKASEGQVRPAIYFWGEVNGTKGLYASLDWFATPPLLISRLPSDLLSEISCIAGDPDRIGRIYAGTGSAGCIRIDLTF
ncbi:MULTISPECIES: WD40/YVTN/BNR-like repeat-containing protein [Sphingomonas]|uniref:WD40/YVTN/BNR-like repeat-containing protein n=1 Tax=Sphingomonas TaxID=13687 RepID=UPI00126A3B20|nr:MULTISPECIES: hypothetical protein [Sphingomonas]